MSKGFSLYNGHRDTTNPILKADLFCYFFKPIMYDSTALKGYMRILESVSLA